VKAIKQAVSVCSRAIGKCELLIESNGPLQKTNRIAHSSFETGTDSGRNSGVYD
jgi:hypothetical protein